MPSTKRDHLVDTALTLFARDGFQGTGIDKILAESGVAKMTLYNHFKSKDELILAVLRRRDETFRNWFMREVERRASSPRGRLLAAFDVLEDWFRQGNFGGCLFINATAEFGDRTDSIRGSCAEHKKLVLDYLTELSREAGAKEPEDLAYSLNLLAEGAIVTAQVFGIPEAARRAKKAADILIRDALGPVSVQ
jgi:AcrR family transcriptional regulator